MNYEYLPETGRAMIRSRLIDFFQQRYKKFKTLHLELVNNTIQVISNSGEETTAIIKLVGELHASARISIGVTKITVIQNHKEVFFVGLDIQSTEEIFFPRKTMVASVLERENDASVTAEPTLERVQRQLDPDKLQTLSEICSLSGIEMGEVESFLIDSDSNGRNKISVFSLKDDKVIPTKQIQPLLQGFFSWMCDVQLQEALVALMKANILEAGHRTTDTTQSRPTTKRRSTKPKVEHTEPKTQLQTQEASPKAARSPYKLPTDFKPKTSYQKTLEALLEAQADKATELLKGIADEEANAIKLIGRLAKKYSKPDTAEKNLLALAKTKVQELAPEQDSNSD